MRRDVWFWRTLASLLLTCCVSPSNEEGATDDASVSDRDAGPPAPASQQEPEDGGHVNRPAKSADCRDLQRETESNRSAYSGDALPDPGVLETWTGSNGVFTDSCDAQGNLTHYACEAVVTCEDAVNPACWDVPTGTVIESTVDCDGRCQGGRCETRCPSGGDELVISEFFPDGSVLLTNTQGSRDYMCTLSDTRSDKVDCTDLRVGRPGRVVQYGGPIPCTGADLNYLPVCYQVEGCSFMKQWDCGYNCRYVDRM